MDEQLYHVTTRAAVHFLEGFVLEIEAGWYFPAVGRMSTIDNVQYFDVELYHDPKFTKRAQAKVERGLEVDCGIVMTRSRDLSSYLHASLLETGYR